ncbi:MAG: ATP-dependent helicase [Actinomycetia bacterium]|nr:ATP-dependent helicase [Actinomycetes bacterium]
MFVLDELNPEQQAVATFTGGPLRVVAGAGTGKTTALTARVATLVGRGTRAERILLLTFTRRAARQMLTRAQSLLERDAPRARVVGGTFHSVAHRTLRRHATKLGLAEGFSVLDTADAADVLDLVREAHGWARQRGRRFPRKSTLLDLYSRAVNMQQPLSSVVESVAPWCADLVEPIGEICREYVARKRTLGLLDFDDLLLWWRAALSDEQLGKTLGAAFDHVLVDEYQDVNALQVDVLQALRANDDRITVVGDDSQAVYGFRAASPRHLLDFAAAFPGAATIVLHRNYRSTQAICDVANSIGADAPEGFEARLVAVRGAGAPPELVSCRDEDAQVAAVCDRVLEQREQGVRLRDQAVLVRAAHHSALLELELSARRVPFVKYGGLRFLEAAHVKDLICLFRLADNRRDELAWFRVLQLLDGVGPATARRMIDALVLDQQGVLERWPEARACLPATARERADALHAALVGVPNEPVVVHAERLRAALVPLLEQRYDDAPARCNDLDALVEAARNSRHLSDVATELTLEGPHSTGDLAGPPSIDEDWLVISTVHSAKGLEWDAVHVLNATDGNFPSDMALTNSDGLEEERRLFYVATTRPRRALHVYVPLRFHDRPRGRDDAHTYGQPSRFLSERVTACFDRTVSGPAEPDVAVASGVAANAVDLALDALFS